MYLLKEGVSKEKGVGTGVLRPGLQVRKAEKRAQVSFTLFSLPSPFQRLFCLVSHSLLSDSRAPFPLSLPALGAMM